MLHGFLQAGLDALPQVSRLAELPEEQRKGRADWLVSEMMNHAAANVGNPVLAALYPRLRPVVDQVLEKHLGPRRVSGKGKAKRRATGKPRKPRTKRQPEVPDPEVLEVELC